MPDITGTFVEGGAGPIARWRVELWRFEENYGWLPHGDATTSVAGSFTLNVPIVGVLALNVATVEVRLVDSVRRIIHRSPQFTLPLTGTHALGTIPVHSNNVRGYLATNLAANGGVISTAADQQFGWVGRASYGDHRGGARDPFASILFRRQQCLPDVYPTRSPD